MDHHLYRCFTKDDIHTTIAQHAQSLRDPNASTPKLFERVSAKLGPCASDIVVGEWSGAVNPGSLHGLGGDSERDARRGWIDAQLELYERFCAGWHFWTFKKAEPGDHGWSMRDAHGGGVFPDFVGMRARASCIGDEERVRWRRDAVKDRALGPYCQDQASDRGGSVFWSLRIDELTIHRRSYGILVPTSGQLRALAIRPRFCQGMGRRVYVLHV